MRHRLVSWNVNGIRSCLDKGFREQLDSLQADVIALQETKAMAEQVDEKRVLGSSPCEITWSSAEKKGYSGTALLATQGLGQLSNRLELPEYDREGRGTLLKTPHYTLVNLYFPNGAASDERHRFKMQFLERILIWFRKLERKAGPLVICGDYNIAHREIDIHDPKSNKDSSGFLPEERAWMDGLTAAGFVDTFRLKAPNLRDQYTWWSFRQRSRERNKGWRLDYFFVSQAIAGAVRKAEIHPEIMGSDHCPVSLELEF